MPPPPGWLASKAPPPPGGPASALLVFRRGWVIMKAQLLLYTRVVVFLPFPITKLVCKNTQIRLLRVCEIGAGVCLE